MTTDSRTAFADDLVQFVRDDVVADAALAADAVDADTDLVMSGLVDSLGVVLIVEKLERRLGIRIDPADVVIEHFESVNAILAYLDRRDDCDLGRPG